jgi:hypothetical protein
LIQLWERQDTLEKKDSFLGLIRNEVGLHLNLLNEFQKNGLTVNHSDWSNFWTFMSKTATLEQVDERLKYILQVETRKEMESVYFALKHHIENDRSATRHRPTLSPVPQALSAFMPQREMNLLQKTQILQRQQRALKVVHSPVSAVGSSLESIQSAPVPIDNPGKDVTKRKRGPGTVGPDIAEVLKQLWSTSDVDTKNTILEGIQKDVGTLKSLSDRTKDALAKKDITLDIWRSCFNVAKNKPTPEKEKTKWNNYLPGDDFAPLREAILANRYKCLEAREVRQ